MQRTYKNRLCTSIRELDSIIESTLRMGVERPTPILVEGERGSGKTSTGRAKAEQFASTHTLRVIDGASANHGDSRLPVYDNGSTVARIVPTDMIIDPADIEAQRPQLIIWDEVGKTPRAAMNDLTTLLDPTPHVGNVVLPPRSMVLSFTNFAEEGLGDVLPDHILDRCEVHAVSKPTGDEWREDYAVPNGLNGAVIHFTTQGRGLDVFQCAYTDGDIAKDNSMIPNPNFRGRVQKTCTLRGLTHAAKLLDMAEQTGMNDELVRKRLQGTIGVEAAAEMDASLAYQRELPAWSDLVTNPDSCMLPQGEGARAVLVYSSLSRMVRPDMSKHYDAVARAVKRMGDRWSDVLFKHTLLHRPKDGRQSPLFEAAQRSPFLREWTANNMDLL